MTLELDRHSSGLWKEFEEKTAGLRGYLKESGGKP
jgi:hypothetical protein